MLALLIEALTQIINSPYVFRFVSSRIHLAKFYTAYRHNPIGKIFSRTELEEIAKLCVEHHIIILSDEVYDRLYYVPYTRIATLSPEVANLTLTVGSVGKAFYATGWRVGYLIGPEHLITHVCTAHTWICYATPGPFQEAAAVGFNEAESRGFWEESKRDMKAKMDRFNEIWDELGLPYTDPQGGYFVLVNTSKVKIPEDYRFPSDIAAQSRDYRLSWFFINEFGVAAIPPTGQFSSVMYVVPILSRVPDFYSTENKHLAENYLRFAVCKPNDVLDLAKERLRGLSKYINAAKTTC